MLCINKCLMLEFMASVNISQYFQPKKLHDGPCHCFRQFMYDMKLEDIVLSSLSSSNHFLA